MSQTMNYFKVQGTTLVFTGKQLEVFVPKRYEMHNALTVTDTVKTVGFFDMVINGTIETGMQWAAMITMKPSTMETVQLGKESFLKLTFVQGDTFLTDTRYVRSTRIAYVLFYEMGYGGHIPKFVMNGKTGTIYDYISHVTGLYFNANHAILEMIESQLERDVNDISKLWRLTNRSKKPTRLGLQAVAQLTQSTTGKLSGSYIKQGLESALAHSQDATIISDIEETLRA